MTDPVSVLCDILAPETPESKLQRWRMLAEEGRLDWRAVSVWANNTDLTAALKSAIDIKGFSETLPALLRSYLNEVHLLNVTRNMGLLQQLRAVVRSLNGNGIRPMVLKGGAALLTELFPDLGTRFMIDLDLVAPEGLLDRSVASLEEAGYRVPEKYIGVKPGQSFDMRDRHHYPPLRHPEQPASVELHHRLIFGPAGMLLEAPAAWQRCREISDGVLGDARAAVMCPTDEVIHCFAHADLVHRTSSTPRLSLRQMHHFAYLVHRHLPELDQGRLEALAADREFGAAFRAYVYLARMLFHVPLPEYPGGVPSEARAYYKLVTSGGRVRKALYLGRRYAAEAATLLSAERLRKAYHEPTGSATRLRLRHLGNVVRRYSSLAAWRRRFAGYTRL